MPLTPLPPATGELFPSAETVCDALRNELNKACPDDVYQFCANYFNRKLQEQRFNLLSLDARGSANFTAEDPASFSAEQVDTSEGESDIYLSGEESLSELDPDDSFLLSSSDDDEPYEPPTYNRGRRTSISAESMAPAKDGEFVKVFISKTPEQRQRIETSISNNFLFKNLDEEQYKDVIDAMSEKRVPEGEDVIVQGGVGDYFYAVEEGSFSVFVSKDGEPEIKVHEYGPGGSFGELALMYNAPRAATVRCVDKAVLWALDRVTFRRILMERTSRKRRMYEGFLEEVPILSNLEPYERHKIADALESIIYNSDEVVIQQGDTGQSFYIIESELALLTDKPRKATVSAKGRLKCATLGKKAFVRLLGPVVEIIKRNSENYAQTANDL